MFRLQGAQNSILAFEKRHHGNTTYHRSVAVEITGSINEELFRKALNIVMQRHDALRSSIYEKNGENHLKFDHENNKETTLPFKFIKTTQANYAHISKLQSTLKKISEDKLINEPFDLQTAPLWRSALINYGADQYQFVMLFHHIIIDETSIGIIFNEISEYYNALIKKQDIQQKPTISLAKFNLDHTEEERKRRLEYWKKQLSELNTLNIKTDLPAEREFHFNGKRIPFTINSSLIKTLATNFPSYSINKILSACLYATLHHYTGETDICLGITSANRKREDKISSDIFQETMVNCFFNSLPLRIKFDKTSCFSDLLPIIKKNMDEEALKNQLPLDDIFQHSLSKENRSALYSASPFNIMIVVNRQKSTLTLDKTISSYPIELDLGHTKFQYFGINCDEKYDGTYDCFIEFNTDLFTQTTIERFAGHLQKVIEVVSKNPDITLANIPLLLDRELKLIETFNATKIEEKTPISISRLIHNTAKETPEKPALVFLSDKNQTSELSYETLDNQSCKLATYIRKLLNTSEQKNIGISLNRSPNLVIATLAGLQSGHIIVPMETTETNSLKHKIETSQPSIVIVDNSTSKLFTKSNCILINLDDLSDQNRINLCKPNHEQIIASSSSAYMMYTSGTTATPKAVLASHAILNNLLLALLNDPNQKKNKKILCIAMPTFDAFLYDIMTMLATKSTLFLTFEKGRNSPEILNTFIKEQQIDTAVFLPDLLDKLDPSLPLKHIISMGAPPHVETFDKWLLNHPERMLFNDLGGTEDGIWLLWHRYQKGDIPTLVGKPIPNMQVYIINPDTGSLCPIGVPGEMFIAGPGLANGYNGNQDLTDKQFRWYLYEADTQRFINVKPNTPHSIRLFASGDYGCYHLNSNQEIEINFLGRRDRQLKMNGVRIEVDSVEAALRNNQHIKDVIVVPNDDKKSLIAYIIPVNSTISVTEIRKQIRLQLAKTALPVIAYPRHVMLISKLLVTQNGKIDTNALPKPPRYRALVANTEYSELQTYLVKVWAKLLHVRETDIDIHATFEENGGHSLSLVELASEILKHSHPSLNSFNIVNMLSLSSTIVGLEITLKPYINSEIFSKYSAQESTNVTYSKYAGVLFSSQPNNRLQHNQVSHNSPSKIQK